MSKIKLTETSNYTAANQGAIDKFVIKMNKEFLQIVDKLLELIKKGKFKEINEIPHVYSRNEQIERLKNEIVNDIFHD